MKWVSDKAAEGDRISRHPRENGSIRRLEDLWRSLQRKLGED